MPSIALEVEYSEDYEDLLADVDLLLEGSEGQIGLVIVVKLNPLKPGEDEISEGFLEGWSYDWSRDTKTKRIRRMV
jgi:hypothetical protein